MERAFIDTRDFQLSSTAERQRQERFFINGRSKHCFVLYDTIVRDGPRLYSRLRGGFESDKWDGRGRGNGVACVF